MRTDRPTPSAIGPARTSRVGPSGVYTVWNDDLFLYVGMAWAHRDEGNPHATGVFGRLKSHASGRRSGDQFAIYVCDRFVIPSLTSADMSALARGERILDARTRQYVSDHLSYRVVVPQAVRQRAPLKHCPSGGPASGGKAADQSMTSWVRTDAGAS